MPWSLRASLPTRLSASPPNTSIHPAGGAREPGKDPCPSEALAHSAFCLRFSFAAFASTAAACSLPVAPAQRARKDLLSRVHMGLETLKEKVLRLTRHSKGKVTEKSPKPNEERNHRTTQSQAFGCVQILLPGVPGGSAGKESACSAGDPGSILGLGRSPGEGKGYPLQYSGLEDSTDSPWGGKESDMTERFSVL